MATSVASVKLCAIWEAVMCQVLLVQRDSRTIECSALSTISGDDGSSFERRKRMSHSLVYAPHRSETTPTSTERPEDQWISPGAPRSRVHRDEKRRRRAGSDGLDQSG